MTPVHEICVDPNRPEHGALVLGVVGRCRSHVEVVPWWNAGGEANQLRELGERADMAVWLERLRGDRFTNGDDYRWAKS